MREFHIGTILSITQDRLISPDGVDGLYAILNYMTGDNLYTHQLPRAMRECRPWLLRQHPQLAGFDGDEINRDNWQDHIARAVAMYGERLSVDPIPADDHERIHPVQELVDMVGPEKVVVVLPSDPQGKATEPATGKE